MVNAGLVDFANKMLSMRKITLNNLINTYWTFENEINESGQMGFVIHGNIQWESTSDWIDCPDGTLLKSNLYDPAGKHILDRPVRNYLQRNMNIYEICGLIPTDINGKDAASAEPILIDNIKRINFITNSLSFLYGASLEWYPAVYRKARQLNIEPPPKKKETEKWVCFPISRSQAESTSTIIQDKDIKFMFQPFTQMVDSIPDGYGDFREIIRTAISWHSFGNRFTSGLYSFNSYWSSYELLANWFYNVSEKMPKKDKREAIMRIISEEITWKNCLPKILKCSEIINPTARTKLKELFKNLPEGDAIKEIIFSRDNAAGKSLFDLRNDVAHGNISDDHLRLKGHMLAILRSARIASKRTILGTIQYHQVSARAYGEVSREE